jgi:hypothetical protein
MKGIQAFYKPDRTARAFWMGRLEKGYPDEVLQVGGKKLSKALIRTRKGVTMAVPQYCISYRKREG